MVFYILLALLLLLLFFYLQVLHNENSNDNKKNDNSKSYNNKSNDELYFHYTLSKLNFPKHFTVLLYRYHHTSVLSTSHFVATCKW